MFACTLVLPACEPAPSPPEETSERALCTHVWAFASTLISRPSPCVPASCRIEEAGYVCTTEPASMAEDGRVCTRFTSGVTPEGMVCGVLCAPPLCIDHDGVTRCEPTCSEDGLTCFEHHLTPEEYARACR